MVHDCDCDQGWHEEGGQGDAKPTKPKRPISPFGLQQARCRAMATPKPDPSKDPLYYYALPRRTNVGISIAALKAKTTPYMDMLALPARSKPKLHYVSNAEREAIAEALAEMSPRERAWLRKPVIPPVITGVSKAALKGKASSRIDVIALARLTYLTYNKRTFKLPKRQLRAVNRHIQECLAEFRDVHPPECDEAYKMVNGVIVHSTCTGREEEVVPKQPMYICQLNANQRKIFRKRMKQIGMPKKIVPRPRPNRGQKKPLKDFQKRLRTLCLPNFNVKDEIYFDPFSVKKTALTYNISERVDEISKPKPYFPPPPFFDKDGNELPPRREWDLESAKRIVASARTHELATPKFIKKKAAEDVKEDPFAVVRRALTAWCSPRTKELAEPARKV